ncbi:MAG: dTDP-4-dehydrorhamnose reductase [Elusimicrobia bacterium]|nr:dTDP-4-dehydrorhamnose reductase [Elusimicrobiota bacterium]
MTGTSGLVGTDLWRQLQEKNEVWAIGRHRPEFVPHSRWRTADIMDQTVTAQTVAQINPDCLIHSAALSNPDDCENDPDLGYRTNALGTRNLAMACQRFDTEILYISTDQVFDGRKSSAYTERDAPNPVNHYGRSKLWGEEFIQTLLRRFYIVRTALVFGHPRPTFVDRVHQAALAQEPLTAATDIVNSPTYSQDLAQAIEILISNHTYGTYHLVNEGFCTRYELASFIAKTLKKKTAFIEKGTKKNLRLKAPRPGYTPLHNFVWNLNGFPRMRSWQEAVGSYLTERGQR